MPDVTKARTTKILAAALAGVVVVAGIVAGAYQVRKSLASRQDTTLYAQAAGHLESGTPRAGLRILLGRPQPRPETQDRWDLLEVQLSARVGAVSRLAAARIRNPKAVEAVPDAMLLIARGMLASGDFEGYTQLRSRARDLGHSMVRWQLVDADRLIAEGRRSEALKALNAIPPGSPQEPARLARLALLAASTDLALSWNYLAEAQRLDPRSPDIRLFRGQLLEAIGKNQLARVEYVAAMLSTPGNPWLADQLAEFYVRQGNYWSAQEIWEEASQNEGGDYLGLKRRFYWRLAGIDFQRNDDTSRKPDKALSESGIANEDAARFSKGLGVGRFWDERAFRAVGGGPSPLADRPEVYWLRLLELLRTGGEEEASKMISDRVAGSTRVIPLPMLEQALAVTLALRLGKPLPRLAVGDRDSGLTGKHEIFTRVESLRPGGSGPRPADPELERFLRGPQAFGGLVLAAGWMEGGLLLFGDSSTTLESPGWVQFGVAQALRFLRGPKVALQYLRLKRTARPAELALLEGENLMAVGQPDEAASVLEPLARGGGSVADRASWLLSADAVRGTNRIGFEAAARANPAFAASIAGRQLEAQLLVAERREEEASRVYTSISKQSLEAKAFLARRSFASGDLATTERLNAEMIEMAPDNLELRNNLLLIRDRQGAR